ncbi:hypothetical protein [Streptomyces sp. NPDC048636]|uniref:hypothetical protein n=1 Tax=Streptomyces sp. NPDC048636 TaxID=3155762 RepID=UPI0034382BF1
MSPPSPPGSLQRAISPAKLSSAADPSNRIDFQYTPTEISISHNAEGISDPIGGEKKQGFSGALQSVYSMGSSRLILSPLTFTGRGCDQVVEKLLQWVQPVSKDTSTAAGGTVGAGEHERLVFEWGNSTSGFNYAVQLMRFDCTYTRFTSDGVPVRAEVRNLTMHILGKSPHLPATPPPVTTAPPGRVESPQQRPSGRAVANNGSTPGAGNGTGTGSALGDRSGGSSPQTATRPDGPRGTAAEDPIRQMTAGLNRPVGGAW